MKSIKFEANKLIERFKDIIQGSVFPDYFTIYHIHHLFLKSISENGYVFYGFKNDNAELICSIKDTHDYCYSEKVFELSDEDKNIKDITIFITDEEIENAKNIVKKYFSSLTPYLTNELIADAIINNGTLIFEVKRNSISDTYARDILIDSLIYKVSGLKEFSNEINLFNQKAFLRNNQQALKYISEGLKKLGLTISTAESITDGKLKSLFSNLPNDLYLGGVVTPDVHSQVLELGVNRKEAEMHNGVGSDIAKDMAIGIENKFNADVNISVTGYDMETEFNTIIQRPIAYMSFKTKTSNNTFKITEKEIVRGVNRDERKDFICASIIGFLIKTIQLKLEEIEE